MLLYVDISSNKYKISIIHCIFKLQLRELKPKQNFGILVGSYLVFFWDKIVSSCVAGLGFTESLLQSSWEYQQMHCAQPKRKNFKHIHAAHSKWSQLTGTLFPLQNWFWCLGLLFSWGILDSVLDGFLNHIPTLAAVQSPRVTQCVCDSGHTVSVCKHLVHI